MQSRFTGIHADDIAYTLSEDRLLHPQQDQNDVLGYVIYYCFFGYFFLSGWMLHMQASINVKLLKSISTVILDHIDFIMSAVFIGYLLIISEFIAILTVHMYLGDFNSTTFHLYLCFPTLIGFLLILFKVMQICYHKKYHWKKSDGLKLLILFFGIGMQLFVFHIYCYALPTFLLLLVYPTKVIAVVAYLTSFIFISSITSSISIHLLINAYIKFHIIGRCTRLMMIAIGILMFFHPILIFAIVIQFLYVLVLGEASAISTGPYTVLSLIPTAAISAAGWLVKNKVFSNVNEKEDKKEPNQENDKSATNGEASTLTLVVNEGTPINGNNQEVKSYGTAHNNN